MQNRLRVCGVISGCMCFVYAYAMAESHRAFRNFLLSFSFQTNLAGLIYLVTLKPYLGQMVAQYLAFVAFVWAIWLGGKEEKFSERMFNYALHYVQPLFVTMCWILVGKPINFNYWVLGLIPPLVYLCALPLITQIIGYEMYPITDNLLQLCVVFLLSDTLLHYIKYRFDARKSKV